MAETLPYYAINASKVDTEGLSVIVRFDTGALDQTDRDAVVAVLADAIGDLSEVASVNSVMEVTATSRAIS